MKRGFMAVSCNTISPLVENSVSGGEVKTVNEGKVSAATVSSAEK